jgi:hypothetical protein
LPKKQFKSLFTVPILFIQSRWDSSNDGPRQWRKFGEMFVYFSNSVMDETHMKFSGKSWGWQNDLRSLYSLKWVRYAPLGSPCKMHPEYIYIWIQWGVEIPKFGWKHETIYLELIPNSLPPIHMKTVSHIQVITCCNLLQLLGCIFEADKNPMHCSLPRRRTTTAKAIDKVFQFLIWERERERERERV